MTSMHKKIGLLVASESHQHRHRLAWILSKSLPILMEIFLGFPIDISTEG